MKETLLFIGIGCVMLFFVVLSILFSSKPKGSMELEQIVNGQAVITKRDMYKELRTKVNNSSMYQKRVNYLQDMLNKTYNSETSPEYIMKFQFLALIGGLGITLLLHLIVNIVILDILALCLTIYFTMMQDLELKNKVKRKNEDFDNALPSFESNMLLGLQASASLPNAMEMAVKTIPEGLVKVEFKKLLLDSKISTDDIMLPYLQLSKRVPTKDCERFCNIVISGLKNGNSMSEILENESEYMNQQVLNRIKAKGEKDGVKAAAITSAMVFLPLLVIFLAPLMASSM